MANRKVYKSMQGKTVDIDLLRQRHELTPAVGNVRVNARGDELGKGGEIVKKREEIVNEYYKHQKPMPDEVPVKRTQTSTQAPKKEITHDFEEPESTTDWVEDEEGNFVRKEDK